MLSGNFNMSRCQIAKFIIKLSNTYSLNCSACLSNRNLICLKRQVDHARHMSCSTRFPFQTAEKNVESFPMNAHYSDLANARNNPGNHYMECSNQETRGILSKDMQVVFDFISEEEENQLMEEVEPYLRRLRYENSHWDDAIHGYRETERKIWTEKNKKIIQRVRDTAFPPGTPQLAYVHVLDLKKEGYIKAHVDAVKFCGNTIAGISLLSSAVMRLVNTEDQTKFAEFLLERRSLYIMKESARYNYTHEILQDESKFKGKTVQKDRRVSVICRNEP